jgi:hypothetical protein
MSDSGSSGRAQVEQAPQGEGTGKAPASSGWPCEIVSADFEANTVTLEMRGTDYRVGAGLHYLKPAQSGSCAPPEGHDRQGARQDEQEAHSSAAAAQPVAPELLGRSDREGD